MMHPLDYYAKDVPVELYAEKLLARKYAYARNPTRENAYQTARAADDAMTVAMKEEDVYIVLVFGAEAMQYYLEILRFEEPEDLYMAKQPSKYDVYFKISVLLEKLMSRTEVVEYKPHLRFLSNGFLARIEGRITADDKQCAEQFNYYYGVGRYKLGLNYGIEDVDYYRDTLLYLQRYLEQEKQRKEYTDSCIDSAINILVDYPELTTSFWVERLRENRGAKEMGLNLGS